VTLWAFRCAIARTFRCLGVGLALIVSVALIRGYERAPDAFWTVFPLGPAEIGGVAFGAFGACELLGRLLSWTKVNGPLPRVSDMKHSL
jgi:hypothetical protein